MSSSGGDSRCSEEEEAAVSVLDGATSGGSSRRRALVLCDLQNDALAKLRPDERDRLLTALVPLVEAARLSGRLVVFSGLRFPTGYEGLSARHRLFGGLARLNAKLGDKAAHWFMEGFSGSELCLAPRAGEDAVVWRTTHLPLGLATLLHDEGVRHAIVAGPSGAVQAACQVLVDESLALSVAAECVADADAALRQATLQHLLPVYADVLPLSEVISEACGFGTTSTFLERADGDASQEALIKLATSAADAAAAASEASNGSASSTPTSRTTAFLPATTAAQPPLPPLPPPPPQQQQQQPNPAQRHYHYCSDCGRRGHGSTYVELLLRRPGWWRYPVEAWYEDLASGRTFHCPLGRKVVDFCDESQFSGLSMFLAGRDTLDDKAKVLRAARQFMPPTFTFAGGAWVDGLQPPSDHDDDDDDDHDDHVGPWFVKEADKNLGGAAIHICAKPSEAAALVAANRATTATTAAAESTNNMAGTAANNGGGGGDGKNKSSLGGGGAWVVQQHVKDPLLTEDGRKAHLKFYLLLVCAADGVSWTLYTYRGALLCISPNRWSAEDLSHDTQITIHRHPQPPGETVAWARHWDAAYATSKAQSLEVLKRAVATEGMLRGRKGKRQFEVFSADWMPDAQGNCWLFEFNLSPAVCKRDAAYDAQHQHQHQHKRTTTTTTGDARREWLMRHDERMLEEALDVVLPWEGGAAPGEWDLAGEFKGGGYL